MRASGFVFVFVFSALVEADAAVLCSRRSGTIKLRDACRPSETQVDPVALGLQGPPGPKGDPGPQGEAAHGAILKDSVGAYIGVISGALPLTNVVLRSAAGKTFRFVWGRAGSDALGAYVDNALYYETADCSGTPLVSLGGSDPAIADAVVQDQVMYYPTTADYITTAIRSYREAYRSDGSCAPGTFSAPDLCCIPDSRTLYVRPASEFNLGPLVPPFHVEGP